MSVEEIKHIYDIKICFTTLIGIQHAINKLYPITKIRGALSKVSPNISHAVSLLLKDKRGSKSIYDTFLAECEFTSKYKHKWEVELGLTHYNWERCNKLIFETVSDKYLQWLQYRIVHRIIGTNKSLFVMKIKNSPLCTFCKLTEESISHLFYECNLVSSLLSLLENHIGNCINGRIIFSKKDVLLGKYDVNQDALNTILLVFKKYIYEAKMSERILNFNVLKSRINEYMNIENNIYKQKRNMESFHKKWDCCISLINLDNN